MYMYVSLFVSFLTLSLCTKFVDGNITMVPLEVALLLTLKPAQSESSEFVTLLDWFDLEDMLILVLERPDPCIGMYDYSIYTGNSATLRSMRLK